VSAVIFLSDGRQGIYQKEKHKTQAKRCVDPVAARTEASMMRLNGIASGHCIVDRVYQ
jgi:hypothetical protein